VRARPVNIKFTARSHYVESAAFDSKYHFSRRTQFVLRLSDTWTESFWHPSLHASSTRAVRVD
jgi:hypothetical protein